MELELIDFSGVRNRNEKMVLNALESFLTTERGNSYRELLSQKDFRDIFALALNKLPARYAQPGTIILGNPVREDDALQSVLDAFDTVLSNPKE